MMLATMAGTVHVTLLQHDGKISRIDPFYSDRSILEVKALVERSTGLLVKDQRLLVGGRSLDNDERSLADYGFAGGSLEIKVVVSRPRQSFVPVTVSMPETLGGTSFELSVRPDHHVATVFARMAELACPVDDRDYFLSFAGAELNPERDLRSQGVSQHAVLRFQPRVIKVNLVTEGGRARPIAVKSVDTAADLRQIIASKRIPVSRGRYAILLGDKDIEAAEVRTDAAHAAAAATPVFSAVGGGRTSSARALSSLHSLRALGVKDGSTLHLVPLPASVHVRLPKGSTHQGLVSVLCDPDSGTVLDVRKAVAHHLLTLGVGAAGKEAGAAAGEAASSALLAEFWLYDPSTQTREQRLDDGAPALQHVPDHLKGPSSNGRGGPAAAAAAAAVPPAAAYAAHRPRLLAVGYGNSPLTVDAAQAGLSYQVTMGKWDTGLELALSVERVSGIPRAEQELSLKSSGLVLDLKAGGGGEGLWVGALLASSSSSSSSSGGCVLNLCCAMLGLGLNGDEKLLPPHPLLLALHRRTECPLSDPSAGWRFNPGALCSPTFFEPGTAEVAALKPCVFQCSEGGHGLSEAAVDETCREWGLPGFRSFLALFEWETKKQQWRGGGSAASGGGATTTNVWPAPHPQYLTHPSMDQVLGRMVLPDQSVLAAASSSSSSSLDSATFTQVQRFKPPSLPTTLSASKVKRVAEWREACAAAVERSTRACKAKAKAAELLKGEDKASTLPPPPPLMTGTGKSAYNGGITNGNSSSSSSSSAFTAVVRRKKSPPPVPPPPARFTVKAKSSPPPASPSPSSPPKVISTTVTATETAAAAAAATAAADMVVAPPTQRREQEPLRAVPPVPVPRVFPSLPGHNAVSPSQAVQAHADAALESTRNPWARRQSADHHSSSATTTASGATQYSTAAAGWQRNHSSPVLPQPLPEQEREQQEQPELELKQEQKRAQPQNARSLPLPPTYRNEATGDGEHRDKNKAEAGGNSSSSSSSPRSPLSGSDAASPDVIRRGGLPFPPKWKADSVVDGRKHGGGCGGSCGGSSGGGSGRYSRVQMLVADAVALPTAVGDGATALAPRPTTTTNTTTTDKNATAKATDKALVLLEAALEGEVDKDGGQGGGGCRFSGQRAAEQEAAELRALNEALTRRLLVELEKTGSQHALAFLPSRPEPHGEAAAAAPPPLTITTGSHKEHVVSNKEEKGRAHAEDDEDDGSEDDDGRFAGILGVQESDDDDDVDISGSCHNGVGQSRGVAVARGLRFQLNELSTHLRKLSTSPPSSPNKIVSIHKASPSSSSSSLPSSPPTSPLSLSKHSPPNHVKPNQAKKKWWDEKNLQKDFYCDDEEDERAVEEVVSRFSQRHPRLEEPRTRRSASMSDSRSHESRFVSKNKHTNEVDRGRARSSSESRGTSKQAAVAAAASSVAIHARTDGGKSGVGGGGGVAGSGGRSRSNSLGEHFGHDRWSYVELVRQCTNEGATADDDANGGHGHVRRDSSASELMKTREELTRHFEVEERTLRVEELEAELVAMRTGTNKDRSSSFSSSSRLARLESAAATVHIAPPSTRYDDGGDAARELGWKRSKTERGRRSSDERKEKPRSDGAAAKKVENPAKLSRPKIAKTSTNQKGDPRRQSKGESKTDMHDITDDDESAFGFGNHHPKRRTSRFEHQDDHKRSEQVEGVLNSGDVIGGRGHSSRTRKDDDDNDSNSGNRKHYGRGDGGDRRSASVEPRRSTRPVSSGDGPRGRESTSLERENSGSAVERRTSRQRSSSLGRDYGHGLGTRGIGSTSSNFSSNSNMEEWARRTGSRRTDSASHRQPHSSEHFGSKSSSAGESVATLQRRRLLELRMGHAEKKLEERRQNQTQLEHEKKQLQFEKEKEKAVLLSDDDIERKERRQEKKSKKKKKEKQTKHQLEGKGPEEEERQKQQQQQQQQSLKQQQKVLEREQGLKALAAAAWDADYRVEAMEQERSKKAAERAQRQKTRENEEKDAAAGKAKHAARLIPTKTKREVEKAAERARDEEIRNRARARFRMPTGLKENKDIAFKNEYPAVGKKEGDMGKRDSNDEANESIVYSSSSGGEDEESANGASSHNISDIEVKQDGDDDQGKIFEIKEEKERSFLSKQNSDTSDLSIATAVLEEEEEEEEKEDDDEDDDDDDDDDEGTEDLSNRGDEDKTKKTELATAEKEEKESEEEDDAVVGSDAFMRHFNLQRDQLDDDGDNRDEEAHVVAEEAEEKEEASDENEGTEKMVEFLSSMLTGLESAEAERRVLGLDFVKGVCAQNLGHDHLDDDDFQDLLIDVLELDLESLFKNDKRQQEPARHGFIQAGDLCDAIRWARDNALLEVTERKEIGEEEEEVEVPSRNAPLSAEIADRSEPALKSNGEHEVHQSEGGCASKIPETEDEEGAEVNDGEKFSIKAIAKIEAKAVKKSVQKERMTHENNDKMRSDMSEDEKKVGATVGRLNISYHKSKPRSPMEDTEIQKLAASNGVSSSVSQRSRSSSSSSESSSSGESDDDGDDANNSPPLSPTKTSESSLLLQSWGEAKAQFDSSKALSGGSSELERSRNQRLSSVSLPSLSILWKEPAAVEAKISAAKQRQAGAKAKREAIEQERIARLSTEILNKSAPLQPTPAKLQRSSQPASPLVAITSSSAPTSSSQLSSSPLAGGEANNQREGGGVAEDATAEALCSAMTAALKPISYATPSFFYKKFANVFDKTAKALGARELAHAFAVYTPFNHLAPTDPALQEVLKLLAEEKAPVGSGGRQKKAAATKNINNASRNYLVVVSIGALKENWDVLTNESPSPPYLQPPLRSKRKHATIKGGDVISASPPVTKTSSNASRDRLSAKSTRRSVEELPIAPPTSNSEVATSSSPAIEFDEAVFAVDDTVYGLFKGDGCFHSATVVKVRRPKVAGNVTTYDVKYDGLEDDEPGAVETNKPSTEVAAPSEFEEDGDDDTEEQSEEILKSQVEGEDDGGDVKDYKVNEVNEDEAHRRAMMIKFAREEEKEEKEEEEVDTVDKSGEVGNKDVSGLLTEFNLDAATLYDAVVDICGGDTFAHVAAAGEKALCKVKGVPMLKGRQMYKAAVAKAKAVEKLEEKEDQRIQDDRSNIVHVGLERGDPLHIDDDDTANELGDNGSGEVGNDDVSGLLTEYNLDAATLYDAVVDICGGDTFAHVAAAGEKVLCKVKGVPMLKGRQMYKAAVAKAKAAEKLEEKEDQRTQDDRSNIVHVGLERGDPLHIDDDDTANELGENGSGEVGNDDVSGLLTEYNLDAATLYDAVVDICGGDTFAHVAAVGEKALCKVKGVPMLKGRQMYKAAVAKAKAVEKEEEEEEDRRIQEKMAANVIEKSKDDVNEDEDVVGEDALAMMMGGMGMDSDDDDDEDESSASPDSEKLTRPLEIPGTSTGAGMAPDFEIDLPDSGTETLETPIALAEVGISLDLDNEEGDFRSASVSLDETLDGQPECASEPAVVVPTLDASVSLDETLDGQSEFSSEPAVVVPTLDASVSLDETSDGQPEFASEPTVVVLTLDASVSLDETLDGQPEFVSEPAVVVPTSGAREDLDEEGHRIFAAGDAVVGLFRDPNAADADEGDWYSAVVIASRFNEDSRAIEYDLQFEGMDSPVLGVPAHEVGPMEEMHASNVGEFNAGESVVALFRDPDAADDDEEDWFAAVVIASRLNGDSGAMEYDLQFVGMDIPVLGVPAHEVGPIEEMRASDVSEFSAGESVVALFRDPDAPDDDEKEWFAAVVIASRLNEDSGAREYDLQFEGIDSLVLGVPAHEVGPLEEIRTLVVGEFSAGESVVALFRDPGAAGDEEGEWFAAVVVATRLNEDSGAMEYDLQFEDIDRPVLGVPAHEVGPMEEMHASDVGEFNAGESVVALFRDPGAADDDEEGWLAAVVVASRLNEDSGAREYDLQFKGIDSLVLGVPAHEVGPMEEVHASDVGEFNAGESVVALFRDPGVADDDDEGDWYSAVVIVSRLNEDSGAMEYDLQFEGMPSPVLGVPAHEVGPMEEVHASDVGEFNAGELVVALFRDPGVADDDDEGDWYSAVVIVSRLNEDSGAMEYDLQFEGIDSPVLGVPAHEVGPIEDRIADSTVFRVGDSVVSLFRDSDAVDGNDGEWHDAVVVAVRGNSGSECLEYDLKFDGIDKAHHNVPANEVRFKDALNRSSSKQYVVDTPKISTFVGSSKDDNKKKSDSLTDNIQEKAELTKSVRVPKFKHENPQSPSSSSHVANFNEGKTDVGVSLDDLDVKSKNFVEPPHKKSGNEKSAPATDISISLDDEDEIDAGVPAQELASRPHEVNTPDESNSLGERVFGAGDPVVAVFRDPESSEGDVGNWYEAVVVASRLGANSGGVEYDLEFEGVDHEVAPPDEASLEPPTIFKVGDPVAGIYKDPNADEDEEGEWYAAVVHAARFNKDSGAMEYDLQFEGIDQVVKCVPADDVGPSEEFSMASPVFEVGDAVAGVYRDPNAPEEGSEGGWYAAVVVAARFNDEFGAMEYDLQFEGVEEVVVGVPEHEVGIADSQSSLGPTTFVVGDDVLSLFKDATADRDDPGKWLSAQVVSVHFDDENEVQKYDLQFEGVEGVVTGIPPHEVCYLGERDPVELFSIGDEVVTQFGNQENNEGDEGGWYSAVVTAVFENEDTGEVEYDLKREDTDGEVKRVPGHNLQPA